MASDHLVLVGLCLANPLWLEVAQLLCHFLKLEFADRRWREMVVQVDMVAVVQVWKRDVSQPTLCHTCQDHHLGTWVTCTAVHWELRLDQTI